MAKRTDGSVQSIKISRTADYYNPTPPKVSDAQVYIENSQGTVFTFNEWADPGLYVCNNFIPELNADYTLTVIVEDQTYTASESLDLTEFTTDVLPYPEYELTDDEFFDGNEIRNEIIEEEFSPGVAVAITLRGVSAQFYTYMNLIYISQ